MKYTAKKLNDKEWAVFTGRRFFPRTTTVSEQIAKESALVMSIDFYNNQMRNAWDELKVVTGGDEYDEDVQLADNVGSHRTDLSDLLC